MAAYTIPTVKFPDSSYLMDSAPISHRLESLYPSPPLHLSSPSVPQAEAIVQELMEALSGETLICSPLNILNDVSAEYFRARREERVGMPLEKYREERGGEKAWEAATPVLKQMGEILKKEEGPFVLGTTRKSSVSFVSP